MRETNQETIDLIPGLPEEIALECLIRLDYSTHRVAARVCRQWHDLLSSKEFYFLRKQTGRTHKAVCLVQSLPSTTNELKPAGAATAYGITVFDTATRMWNRVELAPKHLNGLPLFCRVMGLEGKLVVMGGWDPETYNPVRDVLVYDFGTQLWRQGKDMPESRSFFASGSVNGVVIIAGGHDENKNALNTAWAYDVSGDEWCELSKLSQGRDECEGVVVGEEFWVVSGYGTERQGSFEGSAEVYDFRSGEWRRVEDVWKVGRSPRSCVGVSEDGRFFDWAEANKTVRERMCVVELGERALLSGSEYQGGRQEFYLADGQSGKVEKLDVPDGFVGPVQSGCCIEI